MPADADRLRQAADQLAQTGQFPSPRVWRQDNATAALLRAVADMLDEGLIRPPFVCATALALADVILGEA